MFLYLPIYTVGLKNKQIFTSIWRSLLKIIEEGSATLGVLFYSSNKRILFDSDVPFGTMKCEINKVVSLSIGGNDKELILSGNTKGLIGAG